MKKGPAVHAVLDAGTDNENLELMLMSAVVAVAAVAAVELVVADAVDGYDDALEPVRFAVEHHIEPEPLDAT
jgi:hypothetical protein